jgi:serine protease Do
VARIETKLVLAALAGCAVGVLIVASGVPKRLLGQEEPALEPRASDKPGAHSPQVFWAEPEGAVAAHSIHSRFAILARDAARGLVNVHTPKTLHHEPYVFSLPELFRGPFALASGPVSAQRQFNVTSQGTGFIISSEGHIVTNNHVVDDVDSIRVIFNDGTESDAVIVGQDPHNDIALIRAKEPGEHQALLLGDSDALWPGDHVIAVGNPFGLGHTVTAGIVCTTGRDLGHGPYDNYLRTDAAINSGNSGGPLLNLAGEVVGINTAIVPHASRISFAVPINMAKEILPRLEAFGRQAQAWLGVMVQPITPDLAEAFELPGRAGALVSEVVPKGPADKAGIQRGDVIVGYDGKPIRTMRELPMAVASSLVGKRVEVEVFRDGRTQTFEVRVGLLEEAGALEVPTAPGGSAAAFGLHVEDLTTEGTPFAGGAKGVSSGVIVTDVDPDGPAALAGLRKLDILVELNREPIADIIDLERKLDAVDDTALFLVRRREAALFVAVRRVGS